MCFNLLYNKTALQVSTTNHTQYKSFLMKANCTIYKQYNHLYIARAILAKDGRFESKSHLKRAVDIFVMLFFMLNENVKKDH